jgi:outer membrane protein assembly factor BamB
VYFCTRAYSSRLVCVLNLKTGAILFSQDGRASTTSSSPALADGKVFIMDSSGGLYGFKATQDKYEEVGYVQAGAARCSSPAIAGGKLYLRLKDCVACYDLTVAGNP